VIFDKESPEARGIST
ncbi:hypothetical protein Tco_0651407, partial [Tanacetum coccineum]